MTDAQGSDSTDRSCPVARLPRWGKLLLACIICLVVIGAAVIVVQRLTDSP